ncbi:hypothetical protein HZA87_04835 [Candidatus Uhrbacteria bacterium]|nr:hypothetical protein [Candidatus Uhrbacteria bacterium]
MNREPLKIEEILQLMERVDVPEDTTHRYELRRRLLCSRFFETDRVPHRRWNRLLTYTAPLLAGGMMVGVFSLFAVSTSESIGAPSLISSNTFVGQRESGPKPTLNAFLSSSSGPRVQLADIETLVPQRAVRFVPVSEHTAVLTQ